MEEAAAPAGAAAAGEAAAPETNAISPEEVSAMLETNAAGNVRPYDLTAHRVNLARLPALEAACKSLAEKMAAALGALVGRDVTVQFRSLDPGKAGDFQAALPAPGSLAIVRLKPLPGNAFVSVEPSLLLALLDGYFGGLGRAPGDTQAAILPSAQRFLTVLLRNLAAGVTAAFAPVAPIEMEFVKLETNPRQMKLGASREPILALRFTVEFGEQSGRIDWLMPESLLAPIREILASDDGSQQSSKHEAWAPVLGAALQDAEVETRAIFAQARISLGELVRLAPGDIIPIDAPEHAILLAGDVPLYHGRFGVSQGRNALKIIPGGSR
jgi:flagellar motor switch protein FliM